jgi:putative transposase
MDENRVISLRQKGAIDDPLTEILRADARRLISQPVEAEFDTFLSSTAALVLPDGRQRVVRHGHDPVRAIQTGIGGSAKAKGPRSRRNGGRADTVHVEYSAQMGAAHEEPGRPPACSLPTWDFGGRFPGGPCRLARQGRA